MKISTLVVERTTVVKQTIARRKYSNSFDIDDSQAEIVKALLID